MNMATQQHHHRQVPTVEDFSQVHLPDEECKVVLPKGTKVNAGRIFSLPVDTEVLVSERDSPCNFGEDRAAWDKDGRPAFRVIGKFSTGGSSGEGVVEPKVLEIHYGQKHSGYPSKDVFTADIESMASTAGRYNLRGPVADGPNAGKHFDCYGINSPKYQLAGIAIERESGIFEARAADAVDSVRGYMITFHQSGSQQTTHALLATTSRNRVVAICEHLASNLDNDNLEKAINKLREVAAEFHQG